MERSVDRSENGENFPKIDLQIWKAYAKITAVPGKVGGGGMLIAPKMAKISRK
jgi:hypothetical protein